jgi:tRNA-dihydrouridine synthase A
MLNFVDVVSAAGADRFSVHARKAILGGLSPAENRTIPPLRWSEVHRLKQERPSLLIEINGGIRTLDEAAQHLSQVDAVMIGRAAVDDPWIFADADRRFFGLHEGPVKSRFEAVEGLYSYADALVARGGRLHYLARHLLTLFQGIPGARAFRRHLSEAGQQSDAGSAVLREALSLIPEPQRAQA